MPIVGLFFDCNFVVVPKMEMTISRITRVEKREKELLKKSRKDIEREKKVENIVYFIHGHSSTTFLFLINYNVCHMTSAL